MIHILSVGCLGYFGLKLVQVEVIYKTREATISLLFN